MQRIRLMGNPPISPKDAAPLRFGILGAARIGPNALITPAKSHPGVVVAAVAARDPAKAAKYAKTHNIAKVYGGPDSYQQLIDDPEIDAIYNPLPNMLHYEWTVKALHANKHVLLEKPIADTAAEAAALVALAEQKGLVLLEAIHYCFHPAAQRVREIVRSGELGRLTSVSAEFAVPGLLSRLFFERDDIRFQYPLGGGCMMDVGVYPLAAIRFFADAPGALEVTHAAATPHAADRARVDRGMRAAFALPGTDATAELYCDFAMPGWGPLALLPRLPKQRVTLRMEGGTVEFYGFPIPHVYHYITVAPREGRARTEKVYRRPGGGEDREWWSTYRYQLEAFVDKVRGRTPQYWTPQEDPVNQMKTIEAIYAKAGMPVRPASSLFVQETST